MERIDIKSDREFFREIYSKVEDGKYGIPAFQRDFIWKESAIVAFFDSIWRGYPIGAVILWKPDMKMPTKDILTDNQRNAPDAEYYVLDGRQRLTTFYGCVQNRRLRDRKFELYFNLDTEQFSFTKTNDVLQISVADVYDTFTMLARMQEVTNRFASAPERAKLYVSRANKLNAVLQGYTVSEIKIEGCGLDEAEVVFERINSTGTPISNEFRLQALTYKRGHRLVTEMIQDIKVALKPYHFETLDSDLIIDCFYKFVGKNYYDAKVKDLCKMDFEIQMPEIEDTIKRSVAFLHDDCYVLSEKLLPYKHQLASLTWYFRVHRGEITGSERAGLRKWFIYTSYCRSFNNSSLSNIRLLYNAFEGYVEGKAPFPIVYETVGEPKLAEEKFRHANAQTDFIILATIYRRKRLSPDDTNLSYRGYVRLNSDSVVNYVVCLAENDRQDIENVMFRGGWLSNSRLQELGLSEEMVMAYRSGNIREFKHLRTDLILEMERDLLRSCGLL